MHEESRLRAVVDTAVDGVILIDARGVVLMFNPACEELFGYASYEVVGRNVKMLMPEPYQSGHDGYLRNYRETGERKIIGIGREVMGRKRSGATFPMYLSVGEAQENGEPIFVGIIRDLTERKSAEAAIHESERSFRLLVEGVTDYALFMLDRDGRVATWNVGAERIKQYAADEIIGRHFSVFFTEEDRQAGAPDAALAEARTKGKHESEAWRLRKDGTRFWASVVIDPVRDETGELIGFVKITRDITERKISEAALLEGAERLRAVVDTAVDGVILINAVGIVQMFNPACERLFGYTAAEVVGQNVRMLMPGPYREEHDGYIANYKRTGAAKIIGVGREVTGLRKDGSTFPMDLSVGEAKQEGESIFVGVLHDLTSRKRTEAQLVQAQKMETVGQLSGGIAHDFNNLLTVILGNAEALSLRLKAREDLRQLAETIISAAERGAELTRRLLAFSRRQMLQPMAIDCNGLMENMQPLLRRMLREDVHISMSASPQPLFAMADPAQLESALLNLALNAQDAMPEGGVLTLSIEELAIDAAMLGGGEVKPGAYVCICVTDDGVGMDAETRERVFEPFFTTKEVGKGTGLGLSMVYGFVKQSNGHISLYSEPGLGTSVRLYLPVAEVGREHAFGARAEETAPPLRGSETVLIAEDDPFVRSHAIASLESLGYRVMVAADGREALSFLSGGARPDLLFTDVVMPGGLSGWELAAQARELVPTLRVLFTSGYPQEVLSRRSQVDPRNAGMLSKPYRLAELARHVREALDAPP